MKLAPALLVSDDELFITQKALVDRMSDRFQFDFIDGEFVDNKTVGLDALTGVGGVIDVDLMVAHPSEYVELALASKPSLIIFHVECQEDLTPSINKAKQARVKVGIAYNASSATPIIERFINIVDHVLIMGYDAGFSGQQFQPVSIAHVTEIKKLRDDVEIGFDGGVNATSIPQIKAAGVDIAYVTSAIFSQPDPVAQFRRLEEQAR